MTWLESLRQARATCVAARDALPVGDLARKQLDRSIADLDRDIADWEKA